MTAATRPSADGQAGQDQADQLPARAKWEAHSGTSDEQIQKVVGGISPIRGSAACAACLPPAPGAA